MIEEPPLENHSAICPPEKVSAGGSMPIALYDRGNSPTHSQSQSQTAWLDDASHKIPSPPARLARTSSNKIYMDEMLEGHGIQGKEFHASLFPKVRISSSSNFLLHWD